MQHLPQTDQTILELLRRHQSMVIADFVEHLQVTATAVRQRLSRLMAAEFIERAVVPVEGRGRPSHQYVLTEAGTRQAGSNYLDLAMVLWKEIRSISDPEFQKGLIQRIAGSMADVYQSGVKGDDLKSKMDALARLFGERDIPCEVVQSNPSELPILNTLACPYPELADQDRSVCSMERMLFSELVGKKLKLSECRLDGGSCCSFEVA